MSKGSFISPEQRSGIRARLEPLALAMSRAGLTPNMLTLIGFGIAGAGALLAAVEWWLLAGIIATVGAGFDMFDGAVARATGQVSRLGAFMDSTFDRWGEGVVYLGIVIGSTQAGFDLGAWLAAAALVSAFMVSYTRAKSESLGFSSGTGMAAVGLAPREIRTVILGIGLVGAGLTGGVTADPRRHRQPHPGARAGPHRRARHRHRDPAHPVRHVTATRVLASHRPGAQRAGGTCPASNTHRIAAPGKAGSDESRPAPGSERWCCCTGLPRQRWRGSHCRPPSRCRAGCS